MTNLKNVFFRDNMSAYNALSEIVAVHGIDSVFSALSEITKEQYIQIGMLSASNKVIVTDHGRQFVLTNNA